MKACKRLLAALGLCLACSLVPASFADTASDSSELAFGAVEGNAFGSDASEGLIVSSVEPLVDGDVLLEGATEERESPGDVGDEEIAENNGQDNAEDCTVSEASLVDGVITRQTFDDAAAQTIAYAHTATAEQNGVTFTVGWDDAPAGTATTFHVTQTGGTSAAKARMDVPTYRDTDGSSESVCDPTRSQWSGYYELGDNGHDFTFELTASGTYRINFYFMDTESGVWYLRTTAIAEVNDEARPSVTQIVNSAVAQCYAETSGSEYDAALWLHDWAIDQLEYDHALNWCSAESGLTRGQGTCESYQRIYAKLLNAAGIANGRIEGNGHTWNTVRIDGKWCQMDLTWDDTSDNWYGELDQRHLYFGLTDELMAIAHSDHTANYQADGYAYRSTDLSNNYLVRNGKADEWASAYSERIQQHLDAKETSFSIDADNGTFPPSILGIQNAIVAYAMNQREWSTADGAVTLTATSNVTMISSSSWAAEFDFLASYKSATPGGWSRLSDGSRCYIDASGTLLRGERMIDGRHYFFDWETGAMVTGFVDLPTKTVYYADDGAMQYGQQMIGDNHYYFDWFSGAMARSAFVDLGEKTCYFDENGHMVYAQQKIDGRWYFFDWETGAMATSEFVDLGDKVCYYNDAGRMLFGEQLIDGDFYFFDWETGARSQGFVALPCGKTVYYGVDGAMTHGQANIGGYWYFFDWETGRMAQGQFVDLWEKTCYYDDQGRMVYGEAIIDGESYYFEYWTGALTSRGD